MDNELPANDPFDDPIWEYQLLNALAPYMPWVTVWWEDVETRNFPEPGSYEIHIPEGPPGLRERFTRVGVRSPVRGIQAFPYVPLGYLQTLRGVPGGVSKLLDHIDAKGGLALDNIHIVIKHNVPTIANNSYFFAFIPEKLYQNRDKVSCWLYVTHEELHGLCHDQVLPSLKNKANLKYKHDLSAE